MNNRTKKLSILPLVVLAMAGCTGGPGGGTGAKETSTKISIKNFGGGVGGTWLKNAADEFKELKKDVSYETGKMGVEFSLDSNGTGDVSGGIDRSTNNIFFSESGRSVYDLANSKLLLDISDVVDGYAYGENKKISDKFLDEYDKNSLKGTDGKYYSLPHYEWYPGLVFNKQLFDENQLYFADETSAHKLQFTCTYGSRNFVAVESDKRTCGVDGLYGTEDDGLPTSLEELLILSAKLKENGCVPFIVAGNHNDYTDYLLQGLLASLKLGAANYDPSVFYNFNGEVNVVTTKTGSKLFAASGFADDINYETRTVTNETGYLTRETAERYYALAFLEEIVKADFFDTESTNDGATNRDAQRHLIFGSESFRNDYGMLFEGNYWYNEASALLNEYKVSKNHPEGKSLGWMPLPTQVKGSVAAKPDGSEPNKTALMDMGYSFAYVNANILTLWKRPGLAEACKDFLRFLYSDEQLKKFTLCTGVAKAGMDYEIDMTGLSSFQTQVLSQKINSKVIVGASTNPVFIKNREALILNCTGELWKPRLDKTYDNCFKPFTGSATAWDIMQATKIQSKWSNYLNK